MILFDPATWESRWHQTWCPRCAGAKPGVMCYPDVLPQEPSDR